MAKEFEPYNRDSKTNEFNIWDYSHVRSDTPSSAHTPEETISEPERLKQEAIQQGYAEGMQQAQQDIQSQKQELVKWLELLQKPVHLLDDKLIQEIIQTMIWLSQYCIGIELSVSPDQLRNLFNKIREELPSLQEGQVFAMHPDDVQWIKEHIDPKEISGLHEVLLADPLLNRGDFYLKSEHSELDGRIHTRLVTLFSKYIDKDNLITPIESQDSL